MFELAGQSDDYSESEPAGQSEKNARPHAWFVTRLIAAVDSAFARALGRSKCAA
jgi:hypothetical protein